MNFNIVIDNSGGKHTGLFENSFRVDNIGISDIFGSGKRKSKRVKTLSNISNIRFYNGNKKFYNFKNKSRKNRKVTLSNIYKEASYQIANNVMYVNQRYNMYDISSYIRLIPELSLYNIHTEYTPEFTYVWSKFALCYRR